MQSQQPLTTLANSGWRVIMQALRWLQLSWLEPQTVDLVVAGSSLVTHPWHTRSGADREFREDGRKGIDKPDAPSRDSEPGQTELTSRAMP